MRLVNKYINVDLIKSPMQAGKNNGLKNLDYVTIRLDWKLQGTRFYFANRVKHFMCKLTSALRPITSFKLIASEQLKAYRVSPRW